MHYLVDPCIWYKQCSTLVDLDSKTRLLIISDAHRVLTQISKIYNAKIVLTAILSLYTITNPCIDTAQKIIRYHIKRLP